LDDLSEGYRISRSDSGSGGGDPTADREPAEGGRAEVDETPATSSGGENAGGGTDIITNTGADAGEGEAPSG